MQKMAASLVSLPKLSPRPSNVAGEPLSEWQLAVNEEAAMRKRIAKLKNELHRKRQLVSISEAQRTRDHRASALREHLDEIRGNHTNYLVADVMPLSEDEVTKLSELFNAKCLPATPTTPRISWYTCFKNVDVDSSGRITFKEFASLVRMREGGLNMSAEALSDAQLRALWRALDDDGNGSISTGEFGHFMRKGEEKAAESARARLLAARQAAQRRQRAEGREADGSALTAQLASEEAASEEELREHSALFNQCLYKAVGETDGGAWYRLFRSVDHNRSGRISYDEYEVAVREILALKKSDLADGKLRRLWKALDVDNSGSLSHGEWGRFMKIGQPQGGASPRAQMLAKRFAKAEAAQAEKQRQAEKEKQQFAALASPRFDSIEPSSAEELVALSQTFAEALALLYPHSSPASQWYAVLKEYHHGTTSRSAAVVSTAVPGAAASGVSPACAKGNSAGLRFGFDELRNLVRHGMQLSHSQVSPAKLKALWRALEEHEQGFIEAGAFGRFIRFGVGPGMMVPLGGHEFGHAAEAMHDAAGTSIRLPPGFRTHQQRLAEVREAKLAAVNEETAKRLSAAARQAEHAAAAAAAELQRLEDELKQVGDVQPYSRREGHVPRETEEMLLERGYALAREEIDELRRQAKLQAASGDSLSRKMRQQRDKSSFGGKAGRAAPETMGGGQRSRTPRQGGRV